MHIPVLLQEVVEGLAPKSGEKVLDGTVGAGGHSEALCRAMGGQGIIICLDEDEEALARSRERLAPQGGGGCTCDFLFYHTNFRRLDAALDALGIARVDRALFDLGLSSFQLDTPDGVSGRGFSFQRDEPLKMTFWKEGTGVTAEEIVNEWEAQTLETIISGYSEEPKARRIAQAIVEAREIKRIQTSKELADIVLSVVPRRGKIHPATKTFQALRIAVNDEFMALQETLPKIFERLSPGGRMAFISFHSMEDRLVKRFFKSAQAERGAKLITKKPITPSEEEVRENPRARSAKLRILEKA